MEKTQNRQSMKLIYAGCTWDEWEQFLEELAEEEARERQETESQNRRAERWKRLN